MPIEYRNELTQNAKGGTELMAAALESYLDPKLVEEFQIIYSRVRTLDESKIRILVCNDLPGDPESDNALKKIGHEKFHKIVFVSNWQMQAYIQAYKIPWSKCLVLKNAIVPLEASEKPKDRINLIYHTTPHRGLNILVPVFKKLAEKHENIHLSVFSSFKVYGWEERDAEYQPLYDQIINDPRMTYYGAVSNDEVKAALSKAHIYAYPSTWLETSCISLMEAMSAGVLCVHPNYGALYETAANWTHMYHWNEDINQHAGMFYTMLDDAIKTLGTESSDLKLASAKGYVDVFYNWEVRKHQWEQLLRSLLNEPREFPKTSGQFFSYKS